ncbi:hypothetical protein FACS1894171_1880 [Clostridia bacterium]|nr:hypothetical protein FACS1894171_1880 [Clostridia bacterium]
MSNKINNSMMFILGVAIGSAAAWQYIKKKYEQIAQDEIDSVKEVFSKREADIEDEPEKNTRDRVRAEQAKDKPNIAEYAAKLNGEGYTNYSNSRALSDNKKEEEKKPMDKPFVISPEEFGDFDDYEKISLTYYSDQVLADDNDELVEDIEDVVGFDSLNSFGAYEDDSVFVRNNKLRCDYEILLDHRKFSDVVKSKPHEAEE